MNRNFLGPKANFEMKTGWIVAQFLDHEPVNCASLTDTFIESFSKLLILNTNTVNMKSLSGTKSYRDIRETDPLFATDVRNYLWMTNCSCRVKQVRLSSIILKTYKH